MPIPSFLIRPVHRFITRLTKALLIATGTGVFWPVFGACVMPSVFAAAPKSGYWKFVEPRGLAVARGPGIESFQATAAEGKIAITARRGPPEPQTFAVECFWTWSSPRGLDTLAPGDVLSLSMAIVDHSQYYRTYDGYDHGYAGGGGVIRIDMPNLAVGGVMDTAQDLLTVTAGYQKSDSREATAKVPSGPLWKGRMALKASCPGGLFERIYEWSEAAPPPPEARPLPPAEAKPLCGEALTKYPEFAAKAPVMRMDYGDIQDAFNDAIRKYVAKTNQRPYVDDNIAGTLPALEWLFSEGGAFGALTSPYSKSFVFVSDADRSRWGKSPPTSTLGMEPGTEVYYYNSIYEAAKGKRKLPLSELIFMALEQRKGNMKAAMLLAHNTFRSLARNRGAGLQIDTNVPLMDASLRVKADLTAHDRDFTLVDYSPSFLNENVVSLIDPPPLGDAQSHGALYHLFGTAYFEMQARGSFGENSIANSMWDSRMDARNDDLAQMRKILGVDPQLRQPGNVSLYSRAANLFEQWYRKGISPDDPWKFCYNVYGAQIGSWLYRERLLQRGLLEGLLPKAPPLRPGVVPSILGDLPPSVTLSASPLNMRWSGSGRTMTLNQRSAEIMGDFPVRVLPYYEPDTKTWGLVWSELSDRPYELTLEATQGGWAHITRMAGDRKGTFVYAIPLQSGEQFTLAMDPARPDAPMQKGGGGLIAPIRINASSGAGKSGSPVAGGATAPTPSTSVPRGKPASIGTEAQGTSALASGSALVLDDVPAGSLSGWREKFDPAGINPRIGSEEVNSPFDGSRALRTWAKGNTLATCETKWIRRVYPTGPQQTNGATLEAFLAFAFDGTIYNLPSVKLELLGEEGTVRAAQVYFGKGIIGSFNRGRLGQTGHRELASESGLQRFDLAREFGADLRFSAVAVSLMNYACKGENEIVFDHLVLRTKAAVPALSSPPLSLPGIPAERGPLSGFDVAAAFAATPDRFDHDFKGRSIRVSARFQQVQLTGGNPTVFVRVLDWKIVCAQAESGSSQPLASTALGAPVWISGRMLRVEGNLLWLSPGCVVGTE